MARFAAIAGTLPEMSVGVGDSAAEQPRNGTEFASITYPLPVLTDISGTPLSTPGGPAQPTLITEALRIFGDDVASISDGSPS
jgi:hypothetical protein